MAAYTTIKERLQPFEGELDEMNPSEVERAQAMLSVVDLINDLLSELDDRIRDRGGGDPYVISVGRGTVASLRAHAQAIRLLAEQGLWVPSLCELRAFIEAGAALATFWNDPESTAHDVMAEERVNVRQRMLHLGWRELHAEAYGPLSTIAHHGYTATTSQIFEQHSSIDEPMPEIRPDSDYALLSFTVGNQSGGGLIMAFHRISMDHGTVRYVPLLTTVMTDVTCWLGSQAEIRGTAAYQSLETWRRQSGEASCLFFDHERSARAEP